MSSKPIAIVISDIHFSIANLALASASLKAAISKAKELDLPLVVAGDLNDTKAIIRAEVANELIDILKSDNYDGVPVYILEGNHDKINEKGIGHGLNYLEPYAHIVDSVTPFIFKGTPVTLIPYQSDTENLKQLLEEKSNRYPGSILVMHQGFLGAAMGDYIQDKTSISPEMVKDFTVISGHYHKHQTIQTVTYIGSPYTISFGEANDPPKGFLILNSDGTFTREILNLRKHVIIERDYKDLDRPDPRVNSEDLLWLKVTGPKSELVKIKKADLGTLFLGHSNFKLDLIPNDPEQIKLPTETMTDTQVFDHIIESLDESDDYKTYLKELWREIA